MGDLEDKDKLARPPLKFVSSPNDESIGITLQNPDRLFVDVLGNPIKELNDAAQGNVVCIGDKDGVQVEDQDLDALIIMRDAQQNITGYKEYIRHSNNADGGSRVTIYDWDKDTQWELADDHSGFVTPKDNRQPQASTVYDLKPSGDGGRHASITVKKYYAENALVKQGSMDETSGDIVWDNGEKTPDGYKVVRDDYRFDSDPKGKMIATKTGTSTLIYRNDGSFAATVLDNAGNTTKELTVGADHTFTNKHVEDGGLLIDEGSDASHSYKKVFNDKGSVLLNVEEKDGHRITVKNDNDGKFLERTDVSFDAKNPSHSIEMHTDATGKALFGQGQTWVSQDHTIIDRLEANGNVVSSVDTGAKAQASYNTLTRSSAGGPDDPNGNFKNSMGWLFSGLTDKVNEYGVTPLANKIGFNFEDKESDLGRDVDALANKGTVVTRKINNGQYLSAVASAAAGMHTQVVHDWANNAEALVKTNALPVSADTVSTVLNWHFLRPTLEHSKYWLTGDQSRVHRLQFQGFTHGFGEVGGFIAGIIPDTITGAPAWLARKATFGHWDIHGTSVGDNVSKYLNDKIDVGLEKTGYQKVVAQNGDEAFTDGIMRAPAVIGSFFFGNTTEGATVFSKLSKVSKPILVPIVAHIPNPIKLTKAWFSAGKTAEVTTVGADATKVVTAVTKAEKTSKTMSVVSATPGALKDFTLHYALPAAMIPIEGNKGVSRFNEEHVAEQMTQIIASDTKSYLNSQNRQSTGDVKQDAEIAHQLARQKMIESISGSLSDVDAAHKPIINQFVSQMSYQELVDESKKLSKMTSDDEVKTEAVRLLQKTKPAPIPTTRPGF